MPDRELPTAQPLLRVRRAIDEDAPRAFDGLTWERVDDVCFVEFTAIRADGTVDTYLTKWTFFYYPEWPPHVTFVNPATKEFDPKSWPAVSGSGRFNLAPSYGGAPEGLICNSMFFDWYFYGGHGEQPAVSWKPGHRAIATVAELQIHLQQPFYQGRAQ